MSSFYLLCRDKWAHRHDLPSSALSSGDVSEDDAESEDEHAAHDAATLDAQIDASTASGTNVFDAQPAIEGGVGGAQQHEEYDDASGGTDDANPFDARPDSPSQQQQQQQQQGGAPANQYNYYADDDAEAELRQAEYTDGDEEDASGHYYDQQTHHQV